MKTFEKYASGALKALAPAGIVAVAVARETGDIYTAGAANTVSTYVPDMTYAPGIAMSLCIACAAFGAHRLYNKRQGENDILPDEASIKSE